MNRHNVKHEYFWKQAMMQFLSALSFLLALLLPAGGWAIVQATSTAEPSVEVRSSDAGLVLDISYQVPVPPSEAWTTITDFEHQPLFMPNLDVSRVLLRTGNRLWVEQKGAAKFGIFKFHYESQRELALTPCQLIRSHSLSGDIQMDSTMVLYPSRRRHPHCLPCQRGVSPADTRQHRRRLPQGALTRPVRCHGQGDAEAGEDSDCRRRGAVHSVLTRT